MRYLLAILCLTTLLLGLPFTSHTQVKGVINGTNRQWNDTGSTYGLIIGISKYRNPKIASLQYADKDASLFFQYLLSHGSDSAKTQLLLNEKATCGEIWSQLDLMHNQLKAGDRFYFYFSGHGDIESKTIVPDAFLLAHDAPQGLYASGGTIGISYLKSFLATLSSKGVQVIFIVDACKAGTLIGGREGTDITANVLKEKWKKEIKILSCQAGELSLEGAQWGNGRGLFSFELIEGLNGKADLNKDKLITTQELGLYLSREIPEKARPASQHPVVEGDLEFIIARLKDDQIFANKNPDPAGNDLSAAKKPELVNYYSNLFTQYIDSNILVRYNKNGKELAPCALYYLEQVPHTPETGVLHKLMHNQLSAAMINNLTLFTQHYLSKATRKEDLPAHYYKNVNEQTLLSINLMRESYPGNKKLIETGLISNVLFVQAHQAITKNFELGVRLTDSAIYYNPENPLPLYFKANVMAGRSQQPDSAALFAINRVIDLAPQSWLGYSSLAYYQIFRSQPISFPSSVTKLKDEDKAEVLMLLDMARYIQPVQPGIKLSATYLEKMIKEQHYRFALIDTTRDDFFSTSETFWFHYYRQEYLLALTYAEKAVKLEPENDHMLYNLAATYSLTGQAEPALQWLVKAVHINKNHLTNCVNDSDFEHLRKQPEFDKWYKQTTQAK